MTTKRIAILSRSDRDEVRGKALMGRLEPRAELFSQRSIDWPSVFSDAASEHSARDTGALSPRGEAHRLTVERQNDVATGVSGLLERRRPTAVAWFIVAAAIDAIDRVLRRRARSHVGEEVVERLQPAGADSDATCAVRLVGRSPWIHATIAQIAPNPEGHGLGLAVRDVPRHQGVTLRAPAAPFAPFVQSFDVRDRAVSARTLALPQQSTIFGSTGRPNGGQPAKHLTDGRWRVYTALSHGRCASLRKVLVSTGFAVARGLGALSFYPKNTRFSLEIRCAKEASGYRFAF
jgi:hypothetical protein